MRGLLFVIALSAALVVADYTAAQEEEGLLQIQVSSAFAVLDSPARLPLSEETLTRAGLYRGCEILIYPDLSGVVFPPGVTIEQWSKKPLKQSPLNQDGSLDVYLAPGRYSIINSGCIPVFGAGGFMPTAIDNVGTCCPNVTGEPKFETLRNGEGTFVARYQTVDIVAGQRTQVSVIGMPDEPTSRRTFWLTIAGVMALALLVVVLAGISRIRPRWNPQSPTEEAKSLDPDPNYRPANFDDVFGDFKKK